MARNTPPIAARALLAACAGLCVATAAQAENWYAYYMVPQGVSYVDKDSIIRRPGHVSAKVQSTFPRPQRLEKNGRFYIYTKTVDTIDIDCSALVYRYLERALFNEAGQQQTSVNEADNPQMIVDRTPQDVLAKGFCPKG